jgi:hypothetical protein
MSTSDTATRRPNAELKGRAEQRGRARWYVIRKATGEPADFLPEDGFAARAEAEDFHGAVLGDSADFEVRTMPRSD